MEMVQRRYYLFNTERERERESEGTANFIIITLRVTNYLDVCYSERLLLLLRESILTIIMMTLFFPV